MDFKQLGISEKTVKAIDEIGLKKPTTVQTEVIPSILSGKDVFAIAPQGCGKTCSYVFPLIDIISLKKVNNILILTSDSSQAVMVSDQFALFNKYHESEDEENAANVIIASPDILLDIAASDSLDLSKVNILVVDDINLIKKNKQLANLEKLLDMLPKDRQNVVYTNRRYKDTMDVLDKILKNPEEFKIDKDKEKEALVGNAAENRRNAEAKLDKEAVALSEKNKSFKGKTPEFLLYVGKLSEAE